MKKYPDIHPKEVSLNKIYQWTLELSQFIDDPALANDVISADIFQEWLEEI